MNQQPEDPTPEPEPDRSALSINYLSIGIAIGMTLGMIVGMIDNDIPLWLFLGAVGGIAIGWAMNKVRNRRNGRS